MLYLSLIQPIFSCLNAGYHLIQKILLSDPKKIFRLLWQFQFSSRTIIRLWPWLDRDFNGLGLLTTRLVPTGKQRPVDIAQVVCPLVLVHDALELTDPDSFFDLSESLIILPINYFCPLPIDDMLRFSDMIFHCILLKHVSVDFCSDMVYTYGTFLVSVLLGAYSLMGTHSLSFITKTCLYNIDPFKPHFYIIM